MEKVITETSLKPEDHLDASEVAFNAKEGFLKLDTQCVLHTISNTQKGTHLMNKRYGTRLFWNQPDCVEAVRYDYPPQAVSLSPSRKRDRPLYKKLDKAVIKIVQSISHKYFKV